MIASRKQKGDEPLIVDLLIKLGGAAITNKSSFETPQTDKMQQGAALIKSCLAAGQKVAVVHGAGSFGHYHAKKYQLNKGLKKELNYLGFCETRNSVVKLNKLVVECLTGEGLAAVSCPAFPVWQTSDRTVTQWPKEAIGSVLQAGLVPVFHGDVVLDSLLGCCVLSGDTIMQMLCRSFTVKRVVFLTDVAGVYSKPPTEDGAELLHTVSVENGQVCGSVKLSCGDHDVTGGMQSKIHCAHQIVTASSGRTQVFISELGSQAALELCLDKDADTKKLAATEIVINQPEKPKLL